MEEIKVAEKTGVYMYVIESTLKEEDELKKIQDRLGLDLATQQEQQQPQQQNAGKSRRRHRRGRTLHKRRKSRKVRKTRCRRK
jgi:hypothetical protein